jgi:hypothetical protein
VLEVLQIGNGVDGMDSTSCEAEVCRRATELTAAVQELRKSKAEEHVAQVTSAMERARGIFYSAVEQQHVLEAAQAIKDLRAACQQQQSALSRGIGCSCTAMLRYDGQCSSKVCAKQLKRFVFPFSYLSYIKVCKTV